MSDPMHDRVSALFGAACDLPPAQRGAYLDRECGGDARLRARVEALLANDAGRADVFEDDRLGEGARFLVDATGATGDRGGTPAPESEPAQIGRYRIVRLIGAGGMGTVYEAEQESPRRRVAVKIIRAEMMTPSTVRRFAHEAELLGRLRHPGIAQVYEAGTATTPQGDRPYYAMELIEGKTLSEHARGLTTRARLELIARICDAVEFAHAQGVIHRDLKPANILVDERGQPKVLDFGVARLVGGPSGVDATQHTVAGQLIGTVPYMSPEQVSGDPDRVGAASDVYALGVMLYELLSSRLPLNLARKPLPEAAWMIREQEPSRLGSLDTALRGDIETIAAKALEKDPVRRYATAVALAEDIRRFLRDEPISARPPTTAYQLRKFARRNPALVGGVAATFLALAAGVAGTSIALVRAVRAQRLAVQEADRARIVTAAIKKTLASAGPLANQADDITVAQMLGQAEKELGDEISHAPEAEIEVRTTLGETYLSMGDAPSAERNLRRALDLALAGHGDKGPQTLACADRLARCMVEDTEWDGKNGPREIPFAFRALAHARSTLGPDDPVTVGLADECAQSRFIAGDFTGAAELEREAVAALRSQPTESRPVSFLAALARLAWSLEAVGRDAEAATVRDEAMALAMDDRSDTALDAAQSSHRWCGKLAMIRNDAPLGESLFRRALACQERYLGRWHVQTCFSRMLLTDSLLQQAKFAERIEVVRVAATHARRDNTMGVDQSWWRFHLGYMLRTIGQPDEGCRLCEGVIADLRRLEGDDAPRTRTFWVDWTVRCGLGVLDHWAGEGVRRTTRQMVVDWFRSHSVPTTSPVDWDRLRFRLESWHTGDQESGRAALTLLREGDRNVLRDLPDPKPGIYKLTLDGALAGDQAITLSAWILTAPWKLQLFHSVTDDGAHAAARRLEAEGSPARVDETRECSVLVDENFWDLGIGPLHRNYRFGFLATAQIELPPGRYRFLLRAEDNASLWLDGFALINGWDAPKGSPLSAETTLSPGPHALRVAFAKGMGRAMIWLQVEPIDADHSSDPDAPNPGTSPTK